MPSALQDFEERRRREIASTARRRQLQDEAFRKRLKKTNLKRPPKKKKEGIFGVDLTPSIVDRAAGQIAGSLVSSVGLLVKDVPKAILPDARDLLIKGDYTPERTAGLSKKVTVGTVKGIAEDIRHPRKNIGYLLLDALTLASLGAGSAARATAAGRAFKAARRGEPPTGPHTALPPTLTPPGGGQAVKVKKPKVVPEPPTEKIVVAAPETATPLTNKQKLKFVQRDLGTLERRASHEGRKVKPEEQRAAFVEHFGEEVGHKLNIAYAKQKRAGIATPLDVPAPKTPPVPREGHQPLPGKADVPDEVLDAAKTLGVEHEFVDVAPTSRTLRDKGISPRQLGVNSRNLSKLGVPAEVMRQIETSMVSLHKAKAKPTNMEELHVFEAALGKEGGRKVYSDWKKTRGGSGPMPLGPSLMEGLRAARAVKNQPGTFLLGVRKTKIGAHKAVINVEAPLSRSALVRRGQYVKYGLWGMRPESMTGRMVSRLSKERQQGLRDSRALGGGRSYEQTVKREMEDIKGILHAYRKSRLAIKDKAQFERELEFMRNRKRSSNIGNVMDTFNQAAIIATLYVKPAYLSSNLIGQSILALADHAWMPHSVARSVKMQREIAKSHPEAFGIIKGVMGQGLIKGLRLEQKGASRQVARVHERASRIYGSLLDTPFRDNAFFHEAWRQGHRTPEQVIDLISNPAKLGEFVDVARRANRNMIDFSRLGKLERDVIRRVIFFYPWLKGASIYSARFLTEKPIQATIAVQSGKRIAEAADEEIGPVPSYAEGAFAVGEENVPGLGSVPSIVNPEAIGILGTLAEPVQVAASLLTGTRRASTEPSSFLSPAINLAAASLLRTDPFTNREFPSDMGALEIFKQEVMQSIAPVKAWQDYRRGQKIQKGEVDPSGILYPYSPRARLGRFLGPGVGASVGRPYGEFPINPKEAQSRHFAEERGMASKSKREILKHHDYRNKYLDSMRLTGLLPASAKKLPKELADAFALRAKREANLAATKDDLGRDLRPEERLMADLSLLVQMGKLDEGDVRRILESAPDMSDTVVNRIDSEFRRAFFGSGVISTYKKMINAQREILGLDPLTIP